VVELLALADKVLVGVLVLLTVGYVAINFFADLPRFLVAENLLLAVVYGVLAYGVATGKPWAYPFTVFVASFNAGRVSRSIVGPRGEIGELAIAHLPLFAIIMLAALLALARLLRG